MDLSDYQRTAAKTDQNPGDAGDAILIPLLGLAGEVGSLLSEYKKRRRDGEAHERFDDRIDEDLGDVLWYLAAVATKLGRDLDKVAEANLAKVADRWSTADDGLYRLLDDGYPPHEQIPRQFTAQFFTSEDDAVTLSIDGNDAGDRLRDNSRVPDAFRYHDVLHLSFAAHLGWSPTVRGVLFREDAKRKRRSDPVVDETEDGGRAIVIDEAIVALVFAYARDHRFLIDIDHVDYSLLKTIKLLTGNQEVAVRTAAQWEQAILKGMEAWRTLRDRRGGTVRVDLLARTLTVERPT